MQVRTRCSRFADRTAATLQGEVVLNASTLSISEKSLTISLTTLFTDPNFILSNTDTEIPELVYYFKSLLDSGSTDCLLTLHM